MRQLEILHVEPEWIICHKAPGMECEKEIPQRLAAALSALLPTISAYIGLTGRWAASWSMPAPALPQQRSRHKSSVTHLKSVIWPFALAVQNHKVV